MDEAKIVVISDIGTDRSMNGTREALCAIRINQSKGSRVFSLIADRPNTSVESISTPM